MKRLVANFVVLLIAFMAGPVIRGLHVSQPVSVDSVKFPNEITKTDPSAPTSPTSVIHGIKIYERNCKRCHGELISAGSVYSFDLKEKTPVQVYELITSGEIQSKPKQLPVRNSTEKHPGWPVNLTDKERWDVANYIYSLPHLKSLDLEVGEKSYPYEGEELYQRFCAGCHGLEGYGNGAYSGDFVSVVTNLRKTSWLMRQSDEDLFNSIKYGNKSGVGISSQASWTGMPSFGDMLSDKEINWVVDYVRSFGYRMSGETDYHEDKDPAPDLNSESFENISE